MPNITQPIDDVDRAILRTLAGDARIPNNALAETVGIAPSTCLARVRSLRERGVIRGFRTDMDLAALGLPLQAMIAVKLSAHSRRPVDSFQRTAAGMPHVISMIHLAGAGDYLLHVAVPDSDTLRDFVLDHLTSHPAVRHVETSLIFGSFPGTGPFATLD